MSLRILRAIAYHEAGHAVAAFSLQQRIRYATVRPDNDSLGHVLHHKLKFGSEFLFDDSPRGVDRAERRIVVIFAGPIAQKTFSPRSHWRVNAARDFHDAADLLFRLSPGDEKERNLYGELLWRRAECLVSAQWEDIEAVAKRLLDHRHLSETDVRAAILGRPG